MKWPLVWRSDYDAACQEIRVLEHNVRDARRTNDAEDRYRDLLTKYHELRLQGGAAPTERAALPKKERDEVVDAIDLQAGSDPTLRRHLMRWAKTRQLEQVDQTEIINAILHWQTDDDDGLFSPNDPMSHSH